MTRTDEIKNQARLLIEEADYVIGEQDIFGQPMTVETRDRAMISTVAKLVKIAAMTDDQWIEMLASRS